MRKIISAGMVALALTSGAAPAEASNRSRAASAVERTVENRYGGHIRSMQCWREYGRTYSCDFTGLSSSDISDGDVGGSEGLAYARVGSRVRVRIAYYF